jgi:hypothetical protein
VYGFHKKKSVEGYDMFCQQFFVRNRREMLCYIPRNKVKKIIVDQQLGPHPEGALIKEIKKLQEQQMELYKSLEEIKVQNEHIDISVELTINQRRSMYVL